jgi:cytochrome c oxidase cbb3-type subunit 3
MSDIPAKDPATPQRDKLSEHAYDGIQEYDNPTPGWWVWLFVCSAIFAFFYLIYFHADVTNRSIYDQYNDSVAVNAKKKLAALGIDHLDVSEKNMLQWMTNKDYMAYGQSVFKQNCVSCHGDSGQGLVGPNMTDDYYKNIKVITDIPRVITNGANNGAMPSWQRLGSIDIALVGTYVASLRGQNLPGRKPEGDKIAPWPPLPTPAPSTAPATNPK